MSGEIHQNERQTILTRLLDAVKQCQVRFGGRSELATDLDSRVSCLCSAWETALQHGMRRNNTTLSAFKQITEKSGLLKVANLFSDVNSAETEPVFWHYAREHLSKHELQRFSKLNLVSTDLGRGRAWLRASLNEQALERYMLMLIESDEMLSLFYEDWAFLRDVERNSMLPVMAAGLGSILFAITVDKPELNGGHAASVSVNVQGSAKLGKEACKEMEEPTPVISESVSLETSSKKKERRKKKKVTNLVVFDEDSTTGTVVRKSGLHGSFGSPYFAKENPDGETRGHGDGTPDISVLGSEGLITSGMECSKDPVLSALIRISNQASSVSMETENSSRRQGVGLSGADHDSRILMAPVSSDGIVLGSDLIPVCDTSSTHLWSQGVGDARSFSRQQKEDSVQGGKLAQQSLPSSNLFPQVDNIQRDVKPALIDSLSHDEMKRAVVTMIEKKDSEQELARRLESLVEQEMDTSSTLKAEMEELKKQYTATLENEHLKLQALQKENELLKHQLKKYVSAVQLLRAGGNSQEGILPDDSLPSLPGSTSAIDYSHEAAEYEKKLVQVAEMHGELMEFNELLHRQLGAKDILVRQLMEELIVLRGPLPYDHHAIHDTGQGLDSVLLQRPLINIWIPSAFLRGSASKVHHVYQVYVRIRDEEWNVYRRYSQFLDTHLRLKKVYPLIGTFEFPPKKTIGKKDAKLVETRRKLFQTYLRQVINLMVEKSPEMAANVSKEKLILMLPFFNDTADEGSDGKKK